MEMIVLSKFQLPRFNNFGVSKILEEDRSSVACYTELITTLFFKSPWLKQVC